MLNRKKLLIILFIVIFIGICMYFFQHKKPLNDIVIVLDAGHGGKDEGATGYSGVLEKDINLLTAKLLSNKLEKYGAKVFLTRKDDIFLPLSKRIKFTTKKDADLFISIHYNSSPSSTPKGITTFYYENQMDKLMATKIHNHILSAVNITDRGVLFGDYHVLRENSVPSVLLELGFISNKEEEQHISSSSFQNKISTAITEAIIDFVQNNSIYFQQLM